MNNEPVAWMDKGSNISMIGGIYPKKLEQYLNSLEARIVALESHPVKELTDEEIDAVGDKVSNLIDTYAGRREFARAILRKAIAGSENVATASWVIKQQLEEIEYWKQMFEKAMEAQEK